MLLLLDALDLVPKQEELELVLELRYCRAVLLQGRSTL